MYEWTDTREDDHGVWGGTSPWNDPTPDGAAVGAETMIAEFARL